MFCIFLVFAIVWTASEQSTHTGSNSSQLESKVYNGKPVLQGALIYVASLQADEKHFCTTGIIYWDLLITSASCVCQSMRYMEQSVYVTAVLGHIDYNEGETYNVKSVVHHSEYECSRYNQHAIRQNYKFDVGVVLLDRPINSKFARIIPLRRKPSNANYLRSCSIYGWNILDTDEIQCESSNTDDRTKLHEMTMYIKGMKTCRGLIKFSNFESIQFCGEGKNGQRTTEGDIGSPVVMRGILSDEVFEEVVLAVLSSHWVQDDIYLTRFIRISSVHEEVSKMIKKMKPQATADEGFIICQET